MTEAIAGAGINLRGLSAAAIGKRFVTYLVLDTAADATKVARILTDLPPFGNERSDGICLRKSFYSRPLRGLVSRRALAFLRDNMGGFNLGSASSTSVCAAG